MPTYDPDLLDALEGCAVERVAGTVWRQVLAPSSVTRSNLRGGRWNPSGVETVYCSLDPLTAASEIDNLLAAQPVPIKRQRLTYPLTAQLSHVADLRPQPWGSAFLYEFDLEDAEQCQMIGAAASWLELGALVVPSLRSPGDNLAILVANLAAGDFFEPDGSYDYPPGPPSDVTYQPLAPVEPGAS